MITTETRKGLVECYRLLRQNDILGNHLLLLIPLLFILFPPPYLIPNKSTAVLIHAYPFPPPLSRLPHSLSISSIPHSFLFLHITIHFSIPFSSSPFFTPLGRNKTAYRITVRQLESLIRLSEALARLHLDDIVRSLYKTYMCFAVLWCTFMLCYFLICHVIL